MTTFTNLSALTEFLANTVAARVAEVKTGYSDLSCSAYVSVVIGRDEFAGQDVERIVRFSDHADISSASPIHSDLTFKRTFRVDAIATEVNDEFGEFEHFEVEPADLAEMIDDACDFLNGVVKAAEPVSAERQAELTMVRAADAVALAQRAAIDEILTADPLWTTYNARQRKRKRQALRDKMFAA